MCTTCGCSDHGGTQIGDVGGSHAGSGNAHDHHHPHGADHSHAGDSGPLAPPSPATQPASFAVHPTPRMVQIEQDLLAKNDRLAQGNREWLAGRGAVAWNLMSAPGAGKTTLLERTIRALGAELPIAVIEGDQASRRDAERIHQAGGRAIQINTGSGCHLDAAMLAEGLRRLDPVSGSLVLIENVGNLVCPALFDLGEHRRAVLLSVTEGDDKPLKYPHMFRAAELLILTKIDLLPYVDFDIDRCVGYARRVNPRLAILRVSATSGDGLEAWYAVLRQALGARAPLRHP